VENGFGVDLTMDNPKIFRAFLNGVLKAKYEGDATITPEFIATELKIDSVTDVSAMMQACGDILQQAALNNWELKEFEDYLRSSTSLTENQIVAALQFWRANKQKIHDIVIKKSNWNNGLSKFAWRIDIKSRARNSTNEINEPIAIVEWTLNTNTQNPSNVQHDDATKVVRFEMDRDQIASTLHQINSIQKIITQASQK